LAFAKKMPALMNPWVTNMNGKNYQNKKEEFMLIKLPETQENAGITSKYNKYTNTKVSGCIAVVFVA
jgi:hypothetical protein